MDLQSAKTLMGENFIGPEELQTLSMPLTFGAIQASLVPFDEEVLRNHAQTHLLIFALSQDAAGNPITLNLLREKFGVDPAVSEPCMYNQDWYLKEDFAAKATLDGAWHLVKKEVLEDARAKRPEEIESSLEGDESFPSAVLCAFAFFAWWHHAGGERLWNHDFVWCNDRDHNDDRIYVGRYEDPSGVNKNGFNVHRHLALRSIYSAAPEITS